MVQSLEPDDIQKLKSIIRQGYWFGAATLLFFLYLFFLSLRGAIIIEPLVVIIAGVFISALVVWLLAGTEIKDLKSDKKEVVIKPLEVHDDERKIKVSKTSALVSAWGISKKKKTKHFLLHIDDATFEVTEKQVKEAEQKGSITIHYSLFGRRILKVEV